MNRTNRINGANSLVSRDKIGSGSFNEINKNYQFGSLKIKEILQVTFLKKLNFLKVQRNLIHHCTVILCFACYCFPLLSSKSLQYVYCLPRKILKVDIFSERLLEGENTFYNKIQTKIIMNNNIISKNLITNEKFTIHETFIINEEFEKEKVHYKGKFHNKRKLLKRNVHYKINFLKNKKLILNKNSSKTKSSL